MPKIAQCKDLLSQIHFLIIYIKLIGFKSSGILRFVQSNNIFVIVKIDPRIKEYFKIFLNEKCDSVLNK